MSIEAQTTAQQPRLVVHILVDQLRTDYLEAFSPLYGENGLKRLMTRGRYFPDARQAFKPVDRASATASMVTFSSRRSIFFLVISSVLLSFRAQSRNLYRGDVCHLQLNII